MFKELKSFISKGYLIFNLYNNKEIDQINSIILDKINKVTQNNSATNLKFYDKNHLFTNKHPLITSSKNRFINLNTNLLSKIKNNNTISNILEGTWGHKNYDIYRIGSLLKNKRDPLIKNAATYRIARPYKNFKEDVGGAHSDLNYGGIKNNYLNSLNVIWIPTIGFNKNFTLRIFPETHNIIHPQEAVEKNNQYISSVLSKKYLKKFKSVRHDLKKGDAIIFNPNIIHGGSHNLGNHTRFSIEIRICNNKIFKKN